METATAENSLSPAELLERVKSDVLIREAVYRNLQVALGVVLQHKEVDPSAVEGDDKGSVVCRQIIDLAGVFEKLLNEVGTIAVYGPGDPLDVDVNCGGSGNDLYRTLLRDPDTRRILRDHIDCTICMHPPSGTWVIGEGIDGIDALEAKLREENLKYKAADFYSRRIGKLGRA